MWKSIKDWLIEGLEKEELEKAKNDFDWNNQFIHNEVQSLDDALYCFAFISKDKSYWLQKTNKW